MDVNAFEKKKRDEEEELKKKKGMECVMWEYENDHGTWVAYPPEHQKILEENFEMTSNEVVWVFLPFNLPPSSEIVLSTQNF